ncbi:MAG: substrate-binding domain-containing protein [Nocardioidaceae bacterium]|nr:substrate-binding domain-containing protein [Nocardioidaceae bacterium]MCL2613008.1 substrate-binding domain-containing protein [Nocardioidaceae bacterium]
MSNNVRRGAFVAAALLAGTAGLAACGSSNNNSSSSGSGSGSANVTAACSLSNPPKSTAASLPSGGAVSKASGKVGVILPDTTSSTRYQLFDKPLLTKQLTAVGLTPDVQNAQGDKAKFAQIASTMIGEGVKVLIIDSIDAASGAGVEQQAKQAGIPVIDYDRVNGGGSASYYVSFDNEDVGRLQAQTLVDCLDAQHVSNPNIIMMNGGTDTDHNAVLFKQGAHEVLDPLQQKGKLKIAAEATVKGWNTAEAPTDFNGALSSANNNVQGIVAANDDIANAVIGVLKERGLDGRVAITGQDSQVEGLQNVVTGKQSMTIFKNISIEAQATAQLAAALANGTNPSKAGLKLSPLDDGTGRKIQALLLPPEVITQANVEDVVKAKALTAAEICKGITSDCQKLGVK